eukprot:g81140.t1
MSSKGVPNKVKKILTNFQSKQEQRALAYSEWQRELKLHLASIQQLAQPAPQDHGPEAEFARAALSAQETEYLSHVRLIMVRFQSISQEIRTLAEQLDTLSPNWAEEVRAVQILEKDKLQCMTRVHLKGPGSPKTEVSGVAEPAGSELSGSGGTTEMTLELRRQVASLDSQINEILDNIRIEVFY